MQTLTRSALIAASSLLAFAAGCGVQPGAEVASHVEALVGGPALLVVGSATLNSGDAAVNSRLQALGMSVTVRTASTVTAADATGKQIVVISSTVTSSAVATKLRSVTVPVLLWESALLDDMAMTGATSGTDFGTLSGQQQLAMVVASTDPMAAGLSSTQTVVSSTATFSWGRPTATAVKVANASGDTSRSVLFRYEKGAQMVGLAAPERRTALFLEDTTASLLTTAGRSLVDAAIRWTAHQLANGVACTQSTECGSGFCAGGVCCNTACTGICSTCRGPGTNGTCTGTTGNVCGVASCSAGVLTLPVCSGTGSCSISTQVCASNFCASATMCGAACTADANCPAAFHCTGTGQCLPNAGNGVSCARSGECASGFCAGGVCCNTACTGICSTCRGPGTNGTCTGTTGNVCGVASCSAGVLTQPVCSGTGSCSISTQTCASGVCASAMACAP